MSQAIGHIEILPDPLALAHHVAEWMTEAATAGQGSLRISLSGGSTPKALYGLLASDEFRDRFPWQRVSWYWGDERFVPYDHPESNFRMAREAMLAKAPVPRENIHPIPTVIWYRLKPRGSPLRTDTAADLRCGNPRAAPAALRRDAARAGSRWPYSFTASGRAHARRAQALGGGCRPRAPRGSHHHDLPRAGE